MTQTIIVVPCHNQAEGLRVDRFKRFLQYSKETTFLLVNDGSTDSTLSVLQELQQFDPWRVVVYDLPRKVGKAEAVRQGCRRAFGLDPDFVGYWDADLATPLEVIPEFEAVLSMRPQLEMVFGARVCLAGRCIERRSWEHCCGRVFAALVSKTLGMGIYDTQCGAKLFRVTPRLMSLFAEPFVSPSIFDVEILARRIRSARADDCPPTAKVVYELPLRQWHRIAGSSVRVRDAARIIFELARIYRKYLRGGTTRRSEQSRSPQRVVPAPKFLIRRGSGERAAAAAPSHGVESDTAE